MTDEAYSLRSSTGYWVTRLARSLEADLEKRLAAHEVTRASWAVLSAIQHHDKTTPATLASFIGIDRAAITRHLDRLEKQKLVQRDRCTTDRRTVNLNLTPKGGRLVLKLAAESIATNAKFTASLTQSENDALQATIQKMLSTIDTVPADL
jgi:DNA-binding MarR family transcriptional regulator